jgi:hypothetical protein
MSAFEKSPTRLQWQQLAQSRQRTSDYREEIVYGLSRMTKDSPLEMAIS